MSLTPSKQAKIERNVALINSIGTWGINSVPITPFDKLAPRQIVVADRDNTRVEVAQFLKNARAKNVAQGVWFGVPAGDETALAYATRIVKEVRALDALGAAPQEVCLDLEANWNRQKILDACTYVLKGHVGVNPGDESFVGLTRIVSVTCEPQQSNVVFPWEELYALGIACVYIQCYGATMNDLRDPVWCTAVALGSNVPLHFIKVMIPAARSTTKLLWAGRAVGTFADRIPMTGTIGWAWYLADDWGQPAADPTTFNTDVAAYGKLIGSAIPFGGERRARVSAYK